MAQIVVDSLGDSLLDSNRRPEDRHGTKVDVAFVDRARCGRSRSDRESSFCKGSVGARNLGMPRVLLWSLYVLKSGKSIIVTGERADEIEATESVR